MKHFEIKLYLQQKCNKGEQEINMAFFQDLDVLL